jgi:hypothetical protein
MKKYDEGITDEIFPKMMIEYDHRNRRTRLSKDVIYFHAAGGNQINFGKLRNLT